MKESFFTHDRKFYNSLFSMLAVVALQNVLAYSVNMADNIMLGAYRQEALSGAAVVNQVFFIVQQAAIAIGDGLIVICSQYWGQNRTEPVRRVTGLVLRYTHTGFNHSDTGPCLSQDHQIYIPAVHGHTGSSGGAAQRGNGKNCLC